MNGKLIVFLWITLASIACVLWIKFRDVLYNEENFKIGLSRSRLSMEKSPPLPNVLRKTGYRVETPEGEVFYVKASKETLQGAIIDKEMEMKRARDRREANSLFKSAKEEE